MALPVSVPYAFANATTTQNLSYLDSNFNALANGLNGLANGASQISILSISANGTPSNSTFLRGDGFWVPVSGSGTVTSVAAASANGFSFSGSPITSSGTITLNVPSPGTSGNVLTSDGTNWISQTNAGSGIGTGQTWQNLTSSRSIGVTYTNTTSKPIEVAVAATTLNTTGWYVSVSGVIIGYMYGSGNNSYAPVTMTFIVPVGATYIVSVAIGSPTLSNWSELK